MTLSQVDTASDLDEKAMTCTALCHNIECTKHITRINFGPTLLLVSTSLLILVGPDLSFPPPGGGVDGHGTREPISTRHMDGADLYIEQ